MQGAARRATCRSAQLLSPAARPGQGPQRGRARLLPPPAPRAGPCEAEPASSGGGASWRVQGALPRRGARRAAAASRLRSSARPLARAEGSGPRAGCREEGRSPPALSTPSHHRRLLCTRGHVGHSGALRARTLQPGPRQSDSTADSHELNGGGGALLSALGLGTLGSLLEPQARRSRGGKSVLSAIGREAVEGRLEGSYACKTPRSAACRDPNPGDFLHPPIEQVRDEFPKASSVSWGGGAIAEIKGETCRGAVMDSSPLQQLWGQRDSSWVALMETSLRGRS